MNVIAINSHGCTAERSRSVGAFMSWRVTDSEVDAMIALHNSGEKLESIAEQVSRSVGAVWKVLNERGLIVGRPRVRREKGMKMLREGATIVEVAGSLKVTRAAVYHWLRKLESEARA